MPIQDLLNNCIPPVVSRFCFRALHQYRRDRVRSRIEGQTRLHLGCGGNILQGWANIDRLENDEVINWDLTASLPLQPESVSLIFSEHFIEHITLQQATQLLADCHRALQPDGVLRVSTPNLRKLIDDYLSG